MIKRAGIEKSGKVKKNNSDCDKCILKVIFNLFYGLFETLRNN